MAHIMGLYNFTFIINIVSLFLVFHSMRFNSCIIMSGNFPTVGLMKDSFIFWYLPKKFPFPPPASVLCNV